MEPVGLRAGQGVQQLDIAGGIQKAQGILTGQQQLRNLRATEQATRTQTRVTAAEAAKAEREAAARKWVDENSSKFSRIDAKTGKRSIDYTGLTTSMAEAGYADLAPTVQASWAANTASAIANDTNEQNRAQTAVKFGRDMASQDASIMRNLTPEMQAQQVTRNLEGLRGVAPEAAAAYEAVLMESDLGRSVMALYQAPRTAQQLVDERLQTEGLAQSGAASGVSPAERQPGSPISQAYIQAARAQGLQVPPNASAAQVRQIPGFVDSVRSNIPSAETRTGLAVEAGDLSARAGLIRTGINAISNDLLTQYGRPGSLTQVAFDRLVRDNPALGSLDNAIADYNAKNPNSPIKITDGFNTIRSRLQGHEMEVLKGSQVRGAEAARPPGPRAQPAPVAPPAAAAPNIAPGARAVINGQLMEYVGGPQRSRTSWRPVNE
jgi:hypothetical protein